MILTSGLVKRGRIYYFRMAVPRHLTRRLRRAEVSVSLRTDNLSKAKRSAREISSWVELLFEELREMPDISFEDIDERIRAYFQTCLNDGEEKAMLLPSDPMSDVAAEVAYLREMNRSVFTGGQNSRRIAHYGTCTKEEDLEAVFT